MVTRVLSGFILRAHCLSRGGQSTRISRVKNGMSSHRSCSPSGNARAIFQAKNHTMRPGTTQDSCCFSRINRMSVFQSQISRNNQNQLKLCFLDSLIRIGNSDPFSAAILQGEIREIPEEWSLAVRRRELWQHFM